MGIKLEWFLVGREINLILWCTLTDEAQPSLELSHLSFFLHKVRVGSSAPNIEV